MKVFLFLIVGSLTIGFVAPLFESLFGAENGTDVADKEDITVNDVEDSGEKKELALSSDDEQKPSADKKVSKVKERDFIELYQDGKKSYLANDYKTCVVELEAALKSYHEFSRAVLKCKVKCQKEAEKNFDPTSSGNFELSFYEKLVRQTLCFMNCKNSTIPDLTSQLPKDALDDFEWKVPYDYLQLCYYQVGELRSAANAAYTHLVYNPDSNIMRDNVEWYASALSVPTTDFINLEPFLHTKSFKAGVVLYSEQSWPESVEAFEKAVSEFMEADEQCRMDCEKPFDMGWFPDFVTSVANHYVFCLKCKQKCLAKLSNIDGTVIEDILPLMFNYLQFSYYKLGEIQKAVECAETVLMFEPNHPAMLRNKIYYQTLEKADVAWFEPRPDARKYQDRDQAEKKLLEFINVEFAYYNNKMQQKNPPEQTEPEPEELELKKPVRSKGDLSQLD